jgi:hypothetical protein
MKSLANRSPAEAKAIKKAYKKRTGRDLDEALRDELSDAELKEAKATLSNDRCRYAVARLASAQDGGMLGGTDEQKIHDTLASITDPEMREKVAKQFQKDTGMRLSSMLKDELSGEDLAKAQEELGDVADENQLKTDPAKLKEVQNDPKKIQALQNAAGELRKAMDGAGTTEDAIHNALKGKSPEEIQVLKDMYKEKYKVDLLDQLESELSGTDLQEAVGALSGDPVQAAVGVAEERAVGRRHRREEDLRHPRGHHRSRDPPEGHGGLRARHRHVAQGD